MKPPRVRRAKKASADDGEDADGRAAYHPQAARCGSPGIEGPRRGRAQAAAGGASRSRALAQTPPTSSE